MKNKKKIIITKFVKNKTENFVKIEQPKIRFNLLSLKYFGNTLISSNILIITDI